MSQHESRVLVVGEALVDIVHRVDGSVTAAPGGSPANVALALGRLDRDVALLTALADDEHGAAVRTWLVESGVDVQVAPIERTATAKATLDETGAATYEFDIDWSLAGAASRPEAGIVHVGSIAALREPGAAHLAEVLAGARDASLISYDPNIRPALLSDRDATRAQVEALVAQADVVKASDEDLEWLYPDADLETVATTWQRSGPAIVVVTAGGEGAFAVTAGGRTSIASERVTVVDTVGAGDTFMAALINGLVESGLVGADSRARLRDLDAEALVELLRGSARAAAVTVSRPGADPPWRRELNA